MASPSQVACNFVQMLALLRDRPDAREEQAACFKQLFGSLEGRGIDFRADEAVLRSYGTPVPDSVPQAALLRAHLLERGIGEITLAPGVTPTTLLSVMRALVAPVGEHRSLHELTGSLDAAAREHLVVAPPVPPDIELGDRWTLFGDMVAPEVERRAAGPGHAGSSELAASLATLLAAIEAAPDDPAQGEQLNEVVRAAETLAAEGDWPGLARTAAALVRAERSAREGAYGRAYGIAIRRMLPKSALEQVARLMPFPDHRAAALPVLQRMGADATETLLGLLASADRIADRRAYYGALRQMTEGTELLVNMLTHDEWFVVRNVADLCGELRIELAVPRLARHIAHPDERVRRSVALALARIGSHATVEPLRQVLRDPSPAVRLQLLQAVDGRRNRALAMSIAVLLDEESRPDLQREMMLALGRIGSAEAVQVLVRAAEPGGRLFNRKPVPVRLAAIDGLREAGAPAAAALRTLLQDDDSEVREAARRSIASLE
jgi:hypothetical protein